MTKKKKLLIAIGALAALAALLLAFAYVFIYDGFGIVERNLDWSADLPEDMVLDRSMDRLYVTGENDYLYVRVSKERSPYSDVQGYIDYYFDRFLDNPNWQAANGATVLRHETDGKMHVTSVRFDLMPDGMPDTYTYVTLRTNTRYFFRALLKYDRDRRGEEAAEAVDTFVGTFRSRVHSTGGTRLETDFHPVLPDTWSEETAAAYERLCGAEEPYFGIFSADYSAMEEELGHDFPIVLRYFHLNEPLPEEYMESLYEEGKLTELTLQLTVTANEDLYAASPLVDIVAGRYDGVLADMAEGMRKFGHPFLFRLNNEMNSDWTSYSGVVNMSDPDLYVAAWRYISDFLTAKGVDNAIWIFNPNDVDYPPANWNNYMAYYPGNEYVQVLGVTGYNTGDYYHDVTGESWRDFTQIYDDIETKYGPYFSDFPWMITEFASSSYGGDKAEWITEMFTRISDYDKLKAAVWFDSADFDMSKEDAPPARPYWIAETEETLAAFREGIKGTPERFFE